MFHCRGCGGEGGGSISFVRFLDGCDFLKAVETITRERPPRDHAKKSAKRSTARTGRFVKAYDYCDEIDNLLFQVLRYADPKGFKQRRPDPHYAEAWIPNLDNVRLVPYRLSSVNEAIACEQTIYIVEGEKDADTGSALGVVATTTAMGAGKWKDERGDHYAKFFREDPNAARAQLSPETQNAVYTGRPDDRPWSERHKIVLWAALLLAVALLAWLALRGLKSEPANC